MFDIDDQQEKQEVKSGTGGTITAEDASVLLLRRYGLEKKKIESGQGSSQAQSNMEEFQRAARSLDFYLIANPDGTVKDAYEALTKDLSHITIDAEREKAQRTLSILGDFVVRLGGQVDRLTDEERDYVLQKRADMASSTAKDLEKKEDELMEEILKRGMYRTYFSCRVQDEKGDPVGVTGFNSFYSENSGQYKGWERQWRNVYEYIEPDGYYNKDFDSREANVILDNENVLDAISFKAPYKKVTRKVERVSEEKSVGMWGKEKVKETKDTYDEFDHNEPERDPITGETLVRMQYRTLLNRASQSDIAAEYNDENGRPGNIMILDMVLPESQVKKMQEYADNPQFFRKLVRASVLDPDFGIEGILDKQQGFNSRGSKLSLTSSESSQGASGTVKSEKGLPLYDNAFWKKGSMLIDMDYQVPAGERKAEPVLPQVRKQQSLEKIRSLVRKPVATK